MLIFVLRKSRFLRVCRLQKPSSSVLRFEVSLIGQPTVHIFTQPHKCELLISLIVLILMSVIIMTMMLFIVEKEEEEERGGICLL